MKPNYANGMIKIHTIKNINGKVYYRMQAVGLGGGILHEIYKDDKDKIMSEAYYWNTNTLWPIKDFGEDS